MWAWIWALWWIAWSIDGILALYGTGSGIRPLRALVYSRFWEILWQPIPIIADVGLNWSFGAIGIGGFFVFSQAWWWHTVIVKHWRLPQGRMTFALIGMIAGCLAILAAIGPMSFRYIFINR